MRTTLDAQLQKLNDELIEMGALCEEAIANAMKGLFEQNKALGKQALECDNQIDNKERDIEEHCLKLLLRQQPVASDLRKVSSALRMISDMERIGDHATDIVEISHFVFDVNPQEMTHLHTMAQTALKMLTCSIDSFVKQDLAMAQQTIAMDDELDALFASFKTDLVGMVQQMPQKGEALLDLMMIAKYLERVGDHATNIAEWVEYCLTGVHKSGGN